jgi:hypothetical protein
MSVTDILDSVYFAGSVFWQTFFVLKRNSLWPFSKTVWKIQLRNWKGEKAVIWWDLGFPIWSIHKTLRSPLEKSLIIGTIKMEKSKSCSFASTYLTAYDLFIFLQLKISCKVLFYRDVTKVYEIWTHWLYGLFPLYVLKFKFQYIQSSDFLARVLIFSYLETYKAMWWHSKRTIKKWFPEMFLRVVK